MIGYGACPQCGVDHPHSIRERRKNGDTTCGECNVSTKSSSWPIYESETMSATHLIERVLEGESPSEVLEAVDTEIAKDIVDELDREDGQSIAALTKEAQRLHFF